MYTTGLDALHVLRGDGHHEAVAVPSLSRLGRNRELTLAEVDGHAGWGVVLGRTDPRQPAFRALVADASGGRFSVEWDPATLRACDDPGDDPAIVLHRDSGFEREFMTLEANSEGKVCARGLHIRVGRRWAHLQADGNGRWSGDGARCELVDAVSPGHGAW